MINDRKSARPPRLYLVARVQLGQAAMADSCPPLMLLALLLAAAYAVGAQPPIIKIGRTSPRCGPSALGTYAVNIEAALEFWVNFTNNAGGLVVNGTQHTVQIITCDPLASALRWLTSRSYNDASDPELQGTLVISSPSRPWVADRHPALLYERLILVDQVSALLSTFGNAAPAYAMAENHSVPIINIGDYSIGPLSTGFECESPLLTPSLGITTPGSSFGGWYFRWRTPHLDIRCAASHRRSVSWRI